MTMRVVVDSKFVRSELYIVSKRQFCHPGFALQNGGARNETIYAERSWFSYIG